MTRRPIPFLAAALLLGGAHAGAARAEDLPAPRPGLWKAQMSQTIHPGQQAGPHQTLLTTCIGNDERAQLDALLASMKKNCHPFSLVRHGATYVLKGSCTLKGRHMDIDSTTTFTGDTEYKVVADTRSYGFDVHSVEEHRRIGPCKPGQKPGIISSETR